MEKTSTLDYINQMFPTEASLSGVEPLMQKVHNEIRVVDAEILTAVRQQSNSGSKAKEDLAAATSAVKELMYKVREIKSKAEQSEAMVQEICRDIKKLDFAKKHITTTITALHRLTMLVSAIEQLQVMASKRQYKEASAQLEAVSQLCSHFDGYRDNPKITELRDKFKNIKQILKSHVFSDFSSLGTGKETEETNLLQHLSDACLVVDALEPSVREELVKNFCDKELISYQQIFEGAELAKLDKTERRYAWVKRRLRTNEEIWKIFPTSWHVDYLLCIQFCKLTRTQLEDILENLKEKPDVGTLLMALQRTIEFEEELADKFGGSGSSRTVTDGFEETDKTENNNQAVLDIRKKYEKKLAAHQGNQDEDKDLAVPGAGTSDKDERMICYIVNTAEYCHKTAEELADNVSKIIDTQLADAVDMSEVQDEFSAVITKALVTLVNGLETKFDTEMATMTRVPWSTLESVGDQSEYVTNIKMILNGSIPVLGSLLSTVYFQFFLDKLASSLGPRFYLNIFKCKQISETGAQQMLLDTQAVKTILLDIPSLGKQTSGAASYSKFVSREMSKAEALLKVILSPIDSVADTYSALLPEGTPSEFQRILELKGLKKADQQTILEDFNKRGSGISQAPIATSAVPVIPAVAPNPAPLVSQLSGSVIASREDVLTRAAALGRGAATTGFKRFLALTEAAKDRTDGPFRKLFNA
ncbi:hypothetical protein M8C21_030053 [Ambrosia artemisiifolia]|uniref:Vacuolar protein sorting-associated protein 53 A n=1 Tax=Ambrosia artemisiifolia TaxID=4212 RepID=A0AAD5GGW8_AMBAR|nr:hypothetical protein M8C21_030053 [Ambrosia artemisiifolia]